MVSRGEQPSFLPSLRVGRLRDMVFFDKIFHKPNMESTFLRQSLEESDVSKGVFYITTGNH